jgi:hypothetical protein
MSGFKTWRVTAGDNGMQYLTLRLVDDQVTWTRNPDGGGGDATTNEVWAGLNGPERWLVTEATFGRQDHRSGETRHSINNALSTFTWTSPLTSNEAASMRSEVVPLP